MGVVVMGWWWWWGGGGGVQYYVMMMMSLREFLFLLQEVDIELDLMTPLSDYLISYGIVDSAHQLTATSDNETTFFKLFVDQYDKNYEVGVAARNSIGSSSFTYTYVTAG